MPGRQRASRTYLGSGLALQNPDVYLRGLLEARWSGVLVRYFLIWLSSTYVDKAILPSVRSRWSW